MIDHAQAASAAAALNEHFAHNFRNASKEREAANQRDERADLRAQIERTATSIGAASRLYGDARAVRAVNDGVEVFVWGKRLDELNAELAALLDRVFALK